MGCFVLKYKELANISIVWFVRVVSCVHIDVFLWNKKCVLPLLWKSIVCNILTLKLWAGGSYLNLMQPNLLKLQITIIRDNMW
jgi:hypothetical protein